MKHEKKKPYKCPVCDYGCFYRGNVEKHLKTQHQECPDASVISEENFKCSLCDFSCSSKHDLNIHMYVHYNDDGWICNLCNAKPFKRKDNLKSHIDTVHKGIKKFPCDYCSAGFVRKKHLDAHIASVHGNINQIPNDEQIVHEPYVNVNETYVHQNNHEY